MRKSFAMFVPAIAAITFAACTDTATGPAEMVTRSAPVDTFYVAQRASIDTFYVGQRSSIDTFFVAQRAPVDTFAVAALPVDTLY